MKNICVVDALRVALVVAVMVFGWGNMFIQVSSGATAPFQEDWNLVWSDEFNGTDGSAVDPAKWDFDIGGGGWGNNELEYYTNTNAYLENGSLVIKAQKENYGTDQFIYTSARIASRNRGDWRYGRFEIRAKLPSGKGIWPAIWMYPTDSAYGDWPSSGEIDIMELIGNDMDTVYGTLHYSQPNQSISTPYSLAAGESFANDFHVFALEWERDVFRWYVDGNLYHTETQWNSSVGAYPAPFNRRFHLILNVAVGGNWPGYPDATMVFPQTMMVDYVRVYQHPPATITVDDSGGANFTRIQDAIDNASDGDTILVYSGTYYENVNVNKRLILKGIDNGGGMPVVDANGSGSAITTPAPTPTAPTPIPTATPPFDANRNGSAITLSAGNSTLEGFVATNANAGIKVISNNNIINNNTAMNNLGDGIVLDISSNNMLNGNIALNNAFGIYLKSSSSNTLSDNSASNNLEEGILLDTSSSNTLSGNIAMNNNFFGILLDSSDNNTLSDNTASNHLVFGINLINSSNNTLSGNNASNNDNGINLINSSNNTLSSNNASNNNNGISLGGSNNTLSGNNASNNLLAGISLFSSSYNTIYNNYFNNTNNFGIFNSVNTWNTTKTPGTNIISGSYLGGNFWAYPNGTGFSQTCIDSDKDGICDSPYTLDSSNIDYLPLASPAPAPALSPLVAPFDTTGDGRIQRNEAVACVVRFFSGDVAVPRTTAVAVVVAFFSATAG